MFYSLKTIGILSFFLSSICYPVFVHGQSTVTGTVMAEGESLPGVAVIIKGETRGTVTDFNGNYTIESVSPEAVLVFSFVGYKTTEALVGNQSVVNVEMEVDIQSLQEIVVIGYGTVEKGDLTGAVSSIKSEDLNQGVVQSVQQAIQGRIPGVQITQTSSEPGGGLSIKVRGTSSITGSSQPLYVIDGVPVNNAPLLGGSTRGLPADNNASNPLASINPNDIASIDILKDASATAIYGARGANGVVIVTTKKGTEGKAKISIDHYTGVQSVYEQADVLSRDEYIALQNDLVPGSYPQERIDTVANTDWLDEVTRNAIVTNTNVSFSGGDENTTYFVSGGYFKQDGVLKNTASERYAFRINLASNLSEKLRAEVNLTNSLLVNNPATEGANQNSRGPYTNAAQFNPTIAPRNPDGSLNVTEDGDFLNPLAFIEGQDIEARTNRTFGNIGLTYEIIPGLSVAGKVGIDRQNGRRDVTVDSVARLNSPNVTAQAFNEERTSVLLETTVNYKRQWNNVNLDLVAGATYEEFHTRGFNALGEGFFSRDLSVDGLEGGFDSLNAIGSSRVQSQLASQLFRASVTLHDKILITGSIRRDGSSRFGEDNKWGYFPSAAVAYKLHSENFVPDVLNQLKVRGSYGLTGNNVSRNYVSLNGYEFFTFTDPDTGAEQRAIRQIRERNPDLKWETTRQWDVGIDFGLFQSRISGTIDYYYKDTRDLIASLNTGGSGGGAGRKVENTSRMVNQGFEFALSTINVDGEKFKWTTDLQLTTFNNEIKSLGDRENIRHGSLFASPFAISTPGEPLGSYFLHQVVGVFQSEEEILNTPYADPGIDEVGDYKFLDANGDNQITDADRVIVGNPIPDYTFGIRNTLTYKNFGLDIFIDGQQGAELANANITTAIYPQEIDRNRLAEVADNRWTPSNPTNEYPSLTKIAARAGTNKFNSAAVEDASFIRLQSVRFSYNVPVNSASISNLSLYITGQNLLYITDYSGLNPEANTNGLSSTAVVELNSYPLARTFLAGINITF